MRAGYWEWRPFRDPDRFWDWAMDPHADLDHDTDLDLHDVRFLDRLVAAADRADCPHGGFCCRVLEDFTPRLATRVLGYREPVGRVNRALAERMPARRLPAPPRDLGQLCIGFAVEVSKIAGTDAWWPGECGKSSGSKR